MIHASDSVLEARQSAERAIGDCIAELGSPGELRALASVVLAAVELNLALIGLSGCDAIVGERLPVFDLIETVAAGVYPSGRQAYQGLVCALPDGYDSQRMLCRYALSGEWR